LNCGGGAALLGGGCDLNQSPRTATRFIYTEDGQEVQYVLGETWCEWSSGVVDNAKYHVSYGREFRYDGARQRYLNRNLDPVQLEDDTVADLTTPLWSDYDGNAVYGDFEISGLDAIEKASYQPGMAMTGTWTSSGSANTKYYHMDHLGTTRFMTDNMGAMVDSSVYSSFGERITGANPRYGYVGAFGYQAHDEFAFQHVGHRYSEASTGRFVQRDPIGISGGRNVFEYVESSPLMQVDPTGEGFWGSVLGAVGIVGGAVGAAVAIIGYVYSWPVITTIGAVIAVTALVVTVVEVVNVHRRARQIVAPLVPLMKHRDREYERAMDNTGLGR